MEAEWYYVLITFLFLFLMWLAFACGQLIPNGEAIVWKRKLKPGCWYYVSAIAPSRPFGKSEEECATLQDKHGLYNSILVFLPRKKEYVIEVGDMICRQLWNDASILMIEKQPQAQKA